MKKTTALLPAALFCGILLTGCGNFPEAGQGSGSIFPSSAAGFPGGLYCELKTTDRNGAKTAYLLELTVTEVEGPSDK